MGKLTLTESEKTRIKQLHGLNSVDLINEQDMDNALSQRKCRAKYAKTSEKWTKKGYTKAEEGENYEEGYKTKELINGLCEKETWVKAKKEGNMISRMKDGMSDKKIAKDDAADVNNLNSDIINNIVGAAIGTSGGVNMIDSSNWIVGIDNSSADVTDLGQKTKTVDYFKTAYNAMKGMIQLAATVEVLNNWMMSNTKDCYERITNVKEALSTLNSKYITGSPRKSLQQLDRITRGLNIRNKEIKQLKEVVKTFTKDATLFWNETESGLGGTDKTITSQFGDNKIRNVKDMFRRHMSNLAKHAMDVGGDVEEQLNNDPCSTAMSKTSVKKRKEY
jgi:hypothetical protein